MREKENYRDNLTRISEKFSAELIPYADAAEFLGMDKRTFERHFKTHKVGAKRYISKVELARAIS